MYLLAFLWGPIVFTPLHYLGRGYLTSFANLTGLWLFQLPTNLLVLIAAWLAARWDPVPWPGTKDRLG